MTNFTEAERNNAMEGNNAFFRGMSKAFDLGAHNRELPKQEDLMEKSSKAIYSAWAAVGNAIKSVEGRIEIAKQ